MYIHKLKRSSTRSFVLGNNEGTLFRRSIDCGRLAVMLGTYVYFFFVETDVIFGLFSVISVCLYGLNYGLLFRMGDVAVLILIPWIINFCVWYYVDYMNFLVLLKCNCTCFIIAIYVVAHNMRVCVASHIWHVRS
jgi:hypothetical protein